MAQTEDGNIDLLEDLDSYLEDINGRLTVSRMVSDAVIRGVVAAVQEEAAAEILISKEASVAELARLKESLKECHSTDQGLGLADSLRQMSCCDWRQGQEAIEEGEEDGSGQSSFIFQVSTMREELGLIVRSLSVPDNLPSLGSPCGVGAERRPCQEWDPVLKMDGLDLRQLDGMTKEQLLKYIKNEVSEMRRGYESQFHRLTDDYFFQKRELMRERGPTPFRNKDREMLDLFKEKVSLLLSKLDSFLFEHTKSGRLGSLISENRRLQGLVEEMEKEKDELAAERDGEYNMFTAVVGGVYELLLREVVAGVEDSVLQRLLTEEMEGVVMRAAENEVRVYLEMLLVDGDRALREMAEEVEEKEVMAVEMEEQEKRLRAASWDLENLRGQVREQEAAVARGVQEAERVRAEQEAAIRRVVEACDEHVRGLKEKLGATQQELRECNEERGVLGVLLGEVRGEVEASRVADADNRVRLEDVAERAGRLLKAMVSFQCLVVETVRESTLRLENSKRELSILIPKANTLAKKSLLLKKSLSAKHDEKQKAQREVGILTGEVQSLSSLLRKIYIALDHYSPILHHYPGVVEILKLIRSERERVFKETRLMNKCSLF